MDSLNATSAKKKKKCFQLRASQLSTASCYFCILIKNLERKRILIEEIFMYRKSATVTINRVRTNYYGQRFGDRLSCANVR